MLKKYKNPLNQLYDQQPKLCDRLTFAINHLLNPAEFETTWKLMEEEFNIHERQAIQSLYNEMEMWIGSYFKESYCGPAQSTQGSESVNATVKDGYVDNSTPIHEFVKCFLDMLDHTRESKAQERFNS